MGIREKLNQNPGIGIAVVVIVVACVVFEMYHFFLAGNAPAATGPAGAAPAFFTTDDGATVFSDDSTKAAPFDHNGRQAVRAYVYLINGKQVVEYLEKHSDGQDSNLLVKKPGGKWVDASDPQAAAIKTGKGAGGTELTPLTPVSE
jgi:hypothetical protein